MLNANIIEVVACSDCLKKYTYKMCRFWKVPRQDFVDLVQEIRAEILGCADKYRPDMGHAIPWCQGIARNKVRQYLDQCTRRQEGFSTYDPEAYDPALLPPSPEARTLRREEGCFLSDAFEHELSEREVDVIISHTVDEMPHAEISEELHISVSNSQQCHKRAFDLLACCIPNSLRAIMPPEMRDVLLLAASCNDSHEEIATRLEITQGAAKMRLSRARKMLRKRAGTLRDHVGAFFFLLLCKLGAPRVPRRNIGNAGGRARRSPARVPGSFVRLGRLFRRRSTTQRGRRATGGSPEDGPGRRDPRAN